MIEDMFKITIDQVFPKDSLKKKRYSTFNVAPKLNTKEEAA